MTSITGYLLIVTISLYASTPYIKTYEFDTRQECIEARKVYLKELSKPSIGSNNVGTLCLPTIEKDLFAIFQRFLRRE